MGQKIIPALVLAFAVVGCAGVPPEEGRSAPETPESKGTQRDFKSFGEGGSSQVYGNKVVLNAPFEKTVVFAVRGPVGVRDPSRSARFGGSFFHGFDASKQGWTCSLVREPVSKKFMTILAFENVVGLEAARLVGQVTGAGCEADARESVEDVPNEGNSPRSGRGYKQDSEGKDPKLAPNPLIFM